MKRKPRRGISPEDAELFRDAIGEVRRIELEPAAPERARPAPEPRRLRIDEAEALREAQELRGPAPVLEGDELQAYRRAEVGERDLRRLKRGEFAVQDELDLHHLRAQDAEMLLKQFLNEARSGSRQCVRIIHGKGLRSVGREPVLRKRIRKILTRRDEVLAFVEPRASHGGGGAVVVLLQG